MLARKALAGTAGAPKVYVEDVFSTYLYTGTGAGSTQTITNNIDLSGEGGLVWIKQRTTTYENQLFDTARGGSNYLISDTTGAQNQYNYGNSVSFLGSGFSTTGSPSNQSSASLVSWTFRKAEKFFDVVTYTGTQNSSGTGQTVSHNLGSTPGCIIIKPLSDTSGFGFSGLNNWIVYHRGLSSPTTQFLRLNTTNSIDGNADKVKAVSSTTFTAGWEVGLNGIQYVAYLFAHDAGGFGTSGSDNVISCGSFTTDGSGNATVTLGYEPQWILMKDTQSSTIYDNWYIIDNMRGFLANGNATELYANKSDAENANVQRAAPTATGFIPQGLNASKTYIYIAIRRGPMKTPTTGTSVFAPYVTNTVAASSSGSTSGSALYRSDFVTDFVIQTRKAFADSRYAVSRLTGNQYLVTNSNAAEGTSVAPWDSNIAAINFTTDYGQWMFRRAPGFFDVVCWTATVTDPTTMTVNHNLTVVPQMIIKKARQTNSVSNAWRVYHIGLNGGVNPQNAVIRLDSNGAETVTTPDWGNTAPTSTQFTAGYVESGYTYVAYLFASVAGVSKVGSYTGNGSSVTVTTDFQPRFILVKRTDSTGDWIVSDSARGLVAGNDPYLELNTQDAEVTNEDWVDISSTSFTVNQTTNNANVNTGTYIYLAIA